MNKSRSPAFSVRKDGPPELTAYDLKRVPQKLNLAHVQAIAHWALKNDPSERATENVRKALEAIDQTRCFSVAASAAFQGLLARLGVATVHAIALPA